jgi:hypothetical protein
MTPVSKNSKVNTLRLEHGRMYFCWRLLSVPRGIIPPEPPALAVDTCPSGSTTHLSQPLLSCVEKSEENPPTNVSRARITDTQTHKEILRGRSPAARRWWRPPPGATHRSHRRPLEARWPSYGSNGALRWEQGGPPMGAPAPSAGSKEALCRERRRPVEEASRHPPLGGTLATVSSNSAVCSQVRRATPAACRTRCS